MQGFNHSGNFGDIIYSLPFCLSVMAHKKMTKVNFNLQINVDAKYAPGLNHPCGSVRMTHGLAEMIKPLLEIQPYIGEVTISETIPEDYYNLDDFRKLNIKWESGSITQWYYPLMPEILNLYRPEMPWLIPTEDIDCNDKIVVFRSDRYQRKEVNLSSLKKYKDDIIFLGLPQEHKTFQREVCECYYSPVDNFLQTLNIINSSKLVVGNQTGLFSLAEAINKDRCLETSFECPNVVMSGGRYFSIISEQQLEKTLAELYK